MIELLLSLANGSKTVVDYSDVQKLLASDGAASDYFGYSVAISNDSSVLAVGAYADDDKGTDSGSVYVFTKQANGTYLESQKLTASDGAATDLFGTSVSISNDSSVLAVGAYRDDDKGNDSGSVYVFTKQANGTYLQSQKLTASDGAATDYFGYSVAISNDSSVIAAGAYGDDDKGNNSGSVYVFTKQANGTYLQSQKLTASDGAASDLFGFSVSISNDSSVIAAGAYRDDDKGTDSGSVYVFTKQANGTYLQSQKLLASDGADSDWFGRAISISNDSSVLAVGAYADDDKGNDSGSVYVFTKQANGTYLESQKLLASDGADSDWFGYSVSVSSDGVVLVGASNKDSAKGAVYVYG